MKTVSIKSGQGFECPCCGQGGYGCVVESCIIRCHNEDCQQRFKVDVTPDKIPTAQDMRGILRPDLVERVTKVLFANHLEDMAIRDYSFDDMTEISKAKWRKQARELIDLFPFDDIRELAIDINSTNEAIHSDTIGKSIIRNDSSKIIALCPESAEPKPATTSEIIATADKDALSQICELAETILNDNHLPVALQKSYSEAYKIVDEILAIIDRETRDE